MLGYFDTPFNVPPFDKIKDEHFRPAYDEAIKLHNTEIDSILNNEEDPTFQNTIVALENAGSMLSQVSVIFGNLNSANKTDSLQAIAADMAPVLSAHRDEIQLNAKLFARVKAVYDHKDHLGLDKEDIKLLEETYKGFVRSGANLPEESKEKLKGINSKLSTLTNSFGENLPAEAKTYELVIEDEKDLSGLPEGVRAAAAATAKQKGKEGKWVFTLSN
ncbi:peptidase M3, partial [Brucella sp. 21LCYQ03]|nr:peptidase M3 [Brucella sp. 21LCYQ03]